MKFRFKRRTLLVMCVLSLATLWLALSAVVVWKFTRRDREPFSEPLPSVAWATLESHRLTTSDGEEVGGWFVRGDRQKACVLLLHGNGASRRSLLDVMQWLAEAKFTVLAIDLRAHGDSSGDVNDFGWSARRDVVAAVDFLQRECPQQPIFVEGRSLGAAAAIFAAEELQGRVKGFFLEQPYKDLKSAVWYRLHHHLPVGLDWIAYLGMRLWTPVFLPVDPELVSPYEHIRDIAEDVPIVIIAGSADRHAPLNDVTALFQQVQSHAKLVVFEGAKHEPLDRNDPQLYRTSLFRLLESP